MKTANQAQQLSDYQEAELMEGEKEEISVEYEDGSEDTEILGKFSANPQVSASVLREYILRRLRDVLNERGIGANFRFVEKTEEEKDGNGKKEAEGGAVVGDTTALAKGLLDPKDEFRRYANDILSVKMDEEMDTFQVTKALTCQYHGTRNTRTLVKSFPTHAKLCLILLFFTANIGRHHQTFQRAPRSGESAGGGTFSRNRRVRPIRRRASSKCKRGSSWPQAQCIRRQ
jgi:hypothetical protein